MRVYIIYGQGGVITSFGMYELGKRIAATYPKVVVSYHGWGNLIPIVEDIDGQPVGTKIVLIGYSLGANDVTLIAEESKRTIALGVCYDPSQLGVVHQPPANISRLLLYHNTDIEPEGHAMFRGTMVEVTEISELHLAIDYNPMLHDKTMAALARLT